MPSRRAFLSSVVAGSALLAGCSVLSGRTNPAPDDPPSAGVDDLPDPDRHVFGATGDWSSFGCNASNNRRVADGRAPVDGVTEQWRVPVSQTTREAPVVAGDTVFVLEPDRLRALDAGSGDELWTVPDVDAPPLVRDGVAYATTGSALLALDAASGEELWRREFEDGHVAAPSTYDGEQLVAGVGERAVAVEMATGELNWERRLFGQVLDHPAFFEGYWSVVATAAGVVYLLNGDGDAGWRWQLPATPTSPVVADADSVYANCRDGKTYALTGDGEPRGATLWEAQTGWTPGGLAAASGLVVAANGQSLTAIDAESGDEQWATEMGDWRHTAPAHARDTVFVGGDALYALDPTPGGDPSGGPAERFSREFAGRVGPGPVLDDGTVYVVAEVESGEFALLALA